MDSCALRLANRLVGNPVGAPALEITVAGPTLRFRCDATVALAGAPLDIDLDGAAVDEHQAFDVRAGQTLHIGRVGAGCRAYFAVRGAIDVPEYLGSASTFTLGRFGGHAGRVLRAGDVLHIGQAPSSPALDAAAAAVRVPAYGTHWDIGVLTGPHAAPDFFTPEDMAMLLATVWQVHYNSSRTGVRLIGPKPQWARSDGGEAGLHPSNIHDNAYAVGAIDFTGDMPVILGPDGPSLGGFVCPATVAHAELWKLGQLAPGHTVRFHPLTLAQATDLAARQHAAYGEAVPTPTSAEARTTDAAPRVHPADAAVLHRLPAKAGKVEVVYRRAGDRYVLIEFGPPVLDLRLRFQVHALATQLQGLREAGQLPGLIDLTPGIRSLQVHYDALRMPLSSLMDALLQAQSEVDAVDDIEVPSRTVWLPLSWDDPATRLAIDKYMQSVRADAPWCPSNLEFIRRINGLPDVQAVQDIVFAARYMVLGLGDVYLGAPVATPLDPRHRLVTTKYNPARTWTPENAVGIGGAYLCVYGMEGPGGYQFVGRTVQMWNRWRDARQGARDFEPGKPWLLRFFDQIRFYPVSAQDLPTLRRDFLAGRMALRIEPGRFRLSEYERFLRDEARSIAAFKQTQQVAFEAERERWRVAGLSEAPLDSTVVTDTGPDAEGDTPEGEIVRSEVSGGVWQVLVAADDLVVAGQVLVIVESMKMEIIVEAPRAGRVERLMCAPGQPVGAGQALLRLR
jgi:urea carboxylase